MTETTPVADGLHATPAELLARAAEDLAKAQGAARKKEEQGGSGARQGVLPGGDH